MRYTLIILALFCGKGYTAGHVSAVLTDEHRNQLTKFEQKFLLTLADTPALWKKIEAQGIVRALVHEGQVKGYVVIQTLKDHSLLKRFYVTPDFTDDRTIAQLLAQAPKGLPLLKDYTLYDSHERLEKALKKAKVILKEEHPLYAPFRQDKLKIRDYKNSDFEAYRAANVDSSTHAAFLAATEEKYPGLVVRVIEYGNTYKGFLVEEDTLNEHRILGISNDLPENLWDPVMESVMSRVTSEQTLNFYGSGVWAKKLKRRGVQPSTFSWAAPLDSKTQLGLLPNSESDPANTYVPIFSEDVKGFAMTRLGGYRVSTKDSVVLLKDLALNSTNKKEIEELIIRDLLYRSRLEGNLRVSVNYHLNHNIHFYFRERGFVPGGRLERQPNDWKYVTIEQSPFVRSTNLYDILGLEKGVDTPHTAKPIEEATQRRMEIVARAGERVLAHYEVNGETLAPETLEHNLHILGLPVLTWGYEKKAIAEAIKSEFSLIRRASAILLNVEARAAYDNDWMSLENPTKPLEIKCIKAYSTLMRQDY